MICPSCKTKNQYYHRYCYYCGCKLDTSKTILKDQNPEKVQDFVQPENQSLFDQDQAPETNEVKDTAFDLDTSSKEVKDAAFDLDTSSKEVKDAAFDLDTSSKEVKDAAFDLDTSSKDEFMYNDSIKDSEENQDSDKDYIESISDSQQNLYDYLFNDNDTSDFDITREIPLRRYRKGRSSRNTNSLIKSFTYIAGIALLVFIIFVLFKQIGNNIPLSKQANSSKAIVVSTVVKSTEQDGVPAHQIVFNTTNGKEVKILDTTIPVEDGRAELTLPDSYLYTLNPEKNEDGLLEVHLDSTISAPGFEDVNETVSITLNNSYAPLTLIQPSSNEAIVEGDTFQLVLSVEPGSKVFINDNDYTDLVTEEGKLVKDIDIPPENAETYITIKVTHQGFIENIQEIVLKRLVMEVPITINETSPIPSQGQWVEVTGTTLPGATLTADCQTREDSVMDIETGKFVFYIKASYPGYIPCNLKAELDGKISSTEIIMDGETNVDVYTSTAWKPEYDNMQQDPDLHNGQHFLFRGIVQNILTTGYKNVFVVDTSSDSDSKQLIHVEYWGDDFSFNVGDEIRVFGNRWGNIDDIPRILAKYIYDY